VPQHRQELLVNEFQEEHAALGRQEPLAQHLQRSAQCGLQGLDVQLYSHQSGKQAEVK